METLEPSKTAIDAAASDLGKGNAVNVKKDFIDCFGKTEITKNQAICDLAFSAFCVGLLNAINPRSNFNQHYMSKDAEETPSASREL